MSFRLKHKKQKETPETISIPPPEKSPMKELIDKIDSELCKIPIFVKIAKKMKFNRVGAATTLVGLILYLILVWFVIYI